MTVSTARKITRLGLSFVLSTFILCFTSGVYAKDANSRIPKLSPTLEEYQYPYPVSIFKTEQQEQTLSMAYMDVKPENYHGRNVVLLHGKNFNGAYWKTTIDALSKEGYRVIVPDQIGFGKSSKPDHYQYSFHQLAYNTKSLLEKLGVEQASVLGHSMGGMLATRFALMYPQVADQLILVNPIGLEDYKTLVPYQPVSFWYKGELKKSYQGIKDYQQKNYYDGKWHPDYDPWVNILAGWAKHPEYEKVAWNAALTYDMIFTQPVVYEFRLIRSPTLLIIGTRDRTALGKPLVDKKTRMTMGRYEELGKATQRAIPDATLVELQDVGHLPHIEAFDQYIKPLKHFLDRKHQDDKKPSSKANSHPKH